MGRAPRSKRGKFAVKFSNTTFHETRSAKQWEHLKFVDRMTQNSFKTVQEALLFSLQEEVIDVEEFALLCDQYTPQNLAFRHRDYKKFSLRNKDSAECKADFRFEKTDMPDTFISLNGAICDATEGVYVMLKRFAYPCRLSPMIPIFGRSVPELSMISNEFTEWMYDVHGHRMTEWNHFIMSPDQLQNYSEAVHDKGVDLYNCFGFDHGTVCPISRQGVNQRAVYNGHKRVHALKFQCVALPNGAVWTSEQDLFQNMHYP